MLKYVYIASRIWIVVVYFAGFSSYWTTSWTLLVGLALVPLSTVAFTCAKFAAASDGCVLAVVIVSVLLEVVASIYIGEYFSDSDTLETEETEATIDDIVD